MNRKYFIKKTALFGAGIGLLPNLSWSSFQDIYTLEMLIGKGNPSIEGTTYTSKMQRDTKTSFLAMQEAALKENIQIEVVSAYRSFERQKEIFEGKYIRFTEQGLSPMEAIEKIIAYSTIPGTSRHHWGTDIDLIDGGAKRPKNVLEAKHFHGEGPFCALKEWMTENAKRFGFYEVYTNDPQRKGFEYEPWHFSYAPVSVPMLKAYKKLNLKAILQKEKIKGSMHFTDTFIARYRKQNILDINPELLV